MCVSSNFLPCSSLTLVLSGEVEGPHCPSTFCCQLPTQHFLVSFLNISVILDSLCQVSKVKGCICKHERPFGWRGVSMNGGFDSHPAFLSQEVFKGAPQNPPKKTLPKFKISPDNTTAPSFFLKSQLIASEGYQRGKVATVQGLRQFLLLLLAPQYVASAARKGPGPFPFIPAIPCFLHRIRAPNDLGKRILITHIICLFCPPPT